LNIPNYYKKNYQSSVFEEKLTQIIKVSRPKAIQFRTFQLLGLAVPLAACGSSEDTSVSVNFENFEVRDEIFFSNIVIQDVEKPVWVAALQMDNMEIVGDIMQGNGDVFYYHFMTGAPSYALVNPIRNVQLATPKMREAAEVIFDELNAVFDTQFVPTDNANQTNVISIGTSIQPNTAGRAFFPTFDTFIGSDVFIGTDYSSPEMNGSGVTNPDYEVLLHEIGHALGLKHTFMPDRDNDAILDRAIDNSMWTAMSYNDVPSSFNGSFRALDVMALSEYYGISKTFSAGNDTYYFDPNFGVIIADGAGQDTIEYKDSALSSYIDLREGAVSYLGSKSSSIGDGNQLAIAYTTVVEHVQAGIGNDTVIGNSANNEIYTLGGNDVIFSGEGADLVCAGSGENIVDFSEQSAASDVLIFDADCVFLGFTEVYGFDQIATDPRVRDKLDFSALDAKKIDTLPEDILLTGAQNQNIFSDILSKSHAATFEIIGGYVFVNALNTETGSTQNLYFAEAHSSGYLINEFCKIYGANIDVDFWMDNSFLV
jgi:hypothetical protein